MTTRAGKADRGPEEANCRICSSLPRKGGELSDSLPVPDSHKCPKCGSEMLYQTETLKRLLRWVCSNQDCRYEEKVGGEGK